MKFFVFFSDGYADNGDVGLREFGSQDEALRQIGGKRLKYKTAN